MKGLNNCTSLGTTGPLTHKARIVVYALPRPDFIGIEALPHGRLRVELIHRKIMRLDGQTVPPDSPPM
jgi:hypothetical protein